MKAGTIRSLRKRTDGEWDAELLNVESGESVVVGVGWSALQRFRSFRNAVAKRGVEFNPSEDYTGPGCSERWDAMRQKAMDAGASPD